MQSNPWVFPRVILDNEVQSSDDATKIVKLPLSNNIHTLLIKAKVTNGATSAKNLTMADVIDKIEVVANGSDVIYSMTPREIIRWNLWATGLNIPQRRSEVGGDVQEAVYPVYFGRGMFDPDFFLPCQKMADLEIRIKYSPTISATAFATGTVTLAVLALMTMDGNGMPYRGTLCHKTVKAFTSAASGDDQTLLPRGNMLRQVMVYSYKAASEDGATISRVKFDLNNDERVTANIAWNDLSDWNKLQAWVTHQEDILALTADTDTIDTGVARIRGAQTSVKAANLVASKIDYYRKIITTSGDRVTIEGSSGNFTSGSSTLGADATARATFISVWGEGLSHAVVLDGSYLGEGALLNTSAYDQIRLTLTNAASGADVRISTQELRVL